MTSIKEVFKNLSNNRKVFLFAVISAFSVFLIVSIQKVYAYYHDSFLSSILANKVGDFDLGDGDMNMMIYRENDEGEYIRVYAIPASYYVFDDSQTSCSIPCNDGTGNCEYSFDTTNRAFSLTSSQKVTCKFYFKQEGPTDIKVNMLIEDASANDTYTYNSKTYRLSDNIPAYGYKYSEHYTCDNGATLTYNAETKKVNVSSTSKTTCYVYFDQVGDPDIIVNTYVQEELNGTTYTKVNSIPSNKTYALNSEKSVCTPVNSGGVAGTITYSGGYINVEANGPQECEVYLDLSNAKYLSETIMSLASESGSNVYNEGDAGYRYEGATVNNYITFNNETWRIIGVEEGSKIGLTSGEYYTKIIREYNSSTDSTLFSLPYDSDYDHGNDWSTTSLYTLLNGDYYNRSGSYASVGLTPEAKGLIIDANWYYTPIGDEFKKYTTSGFYTAERSDSTKVVRDAVGIMYPSDYGYAATQSECSEAYPRNYNTGCHNKDWLYDSNNDQWTIIPYSTNAAVAFVVAYGGFVVGNFVGDAGAVRPVVYLDSDVMITNDGDGSVGSKFEVGK